MQVFIVGGAGFIGSHFCGYFLNRPETKKLTIFDNFTSGQEWHIAPYRKDPRFKVERGDVKELDLLTQTMAGHDLVVHLASNPDIAKSMTDPTIDFWEGTYLTHNVLEAMRQSGTKTILYASGSGVYGDTQDLELSENYGPMVPISTYGASKLAGEALIASYCHMFEMVGRCFRFGNVVGPRQTHGVGYDFVRNLVRNPKELRIMGDGTQSKSYIHVDDVISGVMTSYKNESDKFASYNVATGDYITVKEIAQIALNVLGLDVKTVQMNFTGGDRGWKGDVPVIRLNTDRICSLGWSCQKNAAEAIRCSVQSLVSDVRDGRIAL